MRSLARQGSTSRPTAPSREHLSPNCARCSLYSDDYKPVRSEIRPNALLKIAAEAPGREEVRLGRPLVGASGTETLRALAAVGWGRADVSLLNACSCRPPGNDMTAHLVYLSKLNKQRERNGRPPLLSPMEACWPRFRRELQGTAAVLLMGKVARDVLYRKRVITAEEWGLLKRCAKRGDGENSLMSARGYPDLIVLPAMDDLAECSVAVVPTIHAAFAMRKRRWTIPFRWDVAKAVRLATSRLQPFVSNISLFPTNEALANFLSSLDGMPAYDIETGLEGKWNGERSLRCIGIGNDKDVMIVPFQSVQHNPEWHYTREQAAERDSILCHWFAGDIGVDSHKIACDQNGMFDQTVLRHRLPGFDMQRARFDTAIAHHVAWSELPHSLGFQVAQYTDQGAHKDVDHSKWVSDRELHEYCGRDVATTSWNAQQLASDPTLVEQAAVFRNDMFLSTFCMEMHELGLKLDIRERDRWHRHLSLSAERHLLAARERALAVVGEMESATAGIKSLARDLNPNSPRQLGAFLYDVVGLKPLPAKEGGYTNSQEPSTAKPILFALMDRGLSDALEMFLLEVIDFKEDIKLRGTYCEVAPCQDGRVRPTWNPHVAVSGRLTCSKPNVQNLKKSIRTIYGCEPGHALISWDYAQLEARVIAWLAQQTDQIEAFLAGKDIHKVNACAVLGFKSVNDVDQVSRQFTKTFVYAAQYLAAVETVYRMIRNFRARDGSRPYRTRPFSQVEVMFKRFWRNRQAIERFHTQNRALQYETGYLEDAIMGRRRYFLDAVAPEDEREEKANHVIQSTAAAVVNGHTNKLRELFPLGFDGPHTGINHQGHDSLTIECREEHALEVAAAGAAALDSSIGDMPLPVDVQIGQSLGHLVEYERRLDGTIWTP